MLMLLVADAGRCRAARRVDIILHKSASTPKEKRKRQGDGSETLHTALQLARKGDSLLEGEFAAKGTQLGSTACRTSCGPASFTWIMLKTNRDADTEEMMRSHPS